MIKIPIVAKSEKKATVVVAAIITIVEVEAATNITDQSCTLVFKKLSKMSELNSPKPTYFKTNACKLH